MARWGMVIDLGKCVGCKSCEAACEDANRVPRRFWRRVNDLGVSEGPERQHKFLPISCMHCRKAPCVGVCPTGASYRRTDGVVAIDYQHCIGCGYCVLACPYRVRALFKKGHGLEAAYQRTTPGPANSNQQRVGVCTKCNFCLQRLEKGLDEGLIPGVDPKATPACVNGCSANALCFGDLDDAESEASRLIRWNKTSHLLEALGTEPSVYYLVPEGWTEPPWGAPKE